MAPDQPSTDLHAVWDRAHIGPNKATVVLIDDPVSVGPWMIRPVSRLRTAWYRVVRLWLKATGRYIG